MAETDEPASSSYSSSSCLPPPSPSMLTPKEKPVVVRVKRKASQGRPDALWLEISERPPKKALLDLDKLSFSDDSNKKKEKSATRKVLVQHVETISSSEAVKDLLESCLANSSDSREFNRKIEERKHMIKEERTYGIHLNSNLSAFSERVLKLNTFNSDETSTCKLLCHFKYIPHCLVYLKREQLRTTARHKHEMLVRSARFEQIWKSRRTEGERQDNMLHEMCHLYDVIRVDDEEVRETMEEAEDACLEDNAILCNYLPLIREYLPTAAEEIESDMMTSASPQDGFVYDIYSMENDPSANAEDVAQYPLVQVNDDDDCYVDQLESDYETDDSNAENNPLNDYPDEETSEDEGEKGFLSDKTEEYEEEIAYSSEGEAQDWRWSYR